MPSIRMSMIALNLGPKSSDYCPGLRSCCSIVIEFSMSSESCACCSSSIDLFDWSESRLTFDRSYKIAGIRFRRSFSISFFFFFLSETAYCSRFFSGSSACSILIAGD